MRFWNTNILCLILNNLLLKSLYLTGHRGVIKSWLPAIHKYLRLILKVHCLKELAGFSNEPAEVLLLVSG